MKKFMCVFISVLTFLGTLVPSAMAGGIDKEEVLSDGTKLIYVSTERIPEVGIKYSKEMQELLSKRYPTAKNLAIKGFAFSVGCLGENLYNKLNETHPNMALCLRIIFPIIGAIGFFFPDCRDWELGKQYCGVDGRKGYSYQWGPRDYKLEGYGLSSLCKQLYSYYKYSTDPKMPDYNDVQSGITIVLRPRSKWGLSYSDTFVSGVYLQKDMEPHENCPGYRWALINNYIRKGK